MIERLPYQQFERDLPVVPVRQEGAWTLYSRRPNQITCFARAGSPGEEETWLGTRLGVKRLDMDGRLLRLYTRADGLPGDSILAVAVGEEAFCICTAGDRNGSYAVCHLDRLTDRWETLPAVPVPEIRTDHITSDRPRLPKALACDQEGVRVGTPWGTFRYASSTRQWEADPQAVVTAQTPPTTEDVSQHAGWISPAQALPVELEALSHHQPEERVIDADGTTWSVRDVNVLTHAAEDGAEIQRFAPPDKTLALPLPAWCVTTLMGTLFALADDALWSRPLPEGPWTSYPLPVPEGPNTKPGDRRLLVAGGRLWVQADGALRSFDPAIGACGDAIESIAWLRRVLGADGDDLWVEDSRGQVLLRHDARNGGPPELVRVETGNGHPLSPDFFTLAGGMAWCLERVIGRMSYSNLHAFDLKTRAWIEPFSFGGRVDRVSVGAADGVLYVIVAQMSGAQLSETVGAVYGFDPQSQQWETVAHGLPNRPNYNPGGYGNIQFVTIDAEGLWVLDPSSTTLWRWDSARRDWADYPVEQSRGESKGSSFDPHDITACVNEFIFVATGAGLRRFDIPGEQWTRLTVPVPASQRLRMSLQAVDEKAVWAMCSDRRSEQRFGGRFDKATHVWRLWDATEGFPERNEAGQMVSDGTTALATTYRGHLYRLNPSTDFWDDLSLPLFRAWAGPMDELSNFHLSQPLFVGDPPDVYIRGYGQVERTDTSRGQEFASETLVVRINAVRNEFEPMGIPKDYAERTIRILGDGLCVGPDAVWVMDVRGLWRWDKVTRERQLFIPPASFPTADVLCFGQITREEDGALWLIGRDCLLRWALPADNP